MMIDMHLSGCIYGYSILLRYSRSLPEVMGGARQEGSCVGACVAEIRWEVAMRAVCNIVVWSDT